MKVKIAQHYEREHHMHHYSKTEKIGNTCLRATEDERKLLCYASNTTFSHFLLLNMTISHWITMHNLSYFNISDEKSSINPWIRFQTGSRLQFANPWSKIPFWKILSKYNESVIIIPTILFRQNLILQYNFTDDQLYIMIKQD